MRLIIACVNVQNYQGRGAEYVNKLYRAVQRNLSVPHEFHCFTDNGNGLDPAIIRREVPGRLKGWWAKLWMFSPGVFRESERVFYIDLDTLIIGGIDDVAMWGGEFAILRDFYRPDGYGAAIMLWRGGFGAHIWNDWNAAGCPQHRHSDQGIVEESVSDAVRVQDVFPGAFVSYKGLGFAGNPQCAKAPLEGSRVICFHGYPRPHECNNWVAGVWQ